METKPYEFKKCFSRRAQNILCIITDEASPSLELIGKLAVHDASRIRGCGKTTIREIATVLQRYGIKTDFRWKNEWDRKGTSSPWKAPKIPKTRRKSCLD